MGVAQLVRSESSPNPSLRCDAAQVVARGGGRLGSAAGLAVDDAEERADRHIHPAVQPRAELREAPVIHANLAALATLALADYDRAAARVEIWLGQRHRLADPKSRPPQHHNQRPQSEPVVGLTGDA